MNSTVQTRGFDSATHQRVVLFVFFPPFATAGSWRRAHRILALPPTSTSLIIAGVIEIRIKRVRVEVKGREWSAGRGA